MKITKEGNYSLGMKMHNAKLYLKEAPIIYGFHQLSAIARASVKVGKTRMPQLVQPRAQQQAFT